MTTQQHNNEMNLAWKFIEGTDVSVFLTGKAGTGKTSFLRRIKELAPKRMVVVAPTGVAAINAQGVTIHSFFQLPIGVHVPGAKEHNSNSARMQMSKEKKNIIRTMDLLVIDEISMVRADLLDAVDASLRQYRDKYQPFGGVQLLLIGDLQQLAPVATEKEWSVLQEYYDTPYFFSSKALQQVEYVTIELQHIYRQSDEQFIRLLGNIREGKLDAETASMLNTRYIPNFQPADNEGYIRLTTHNHMASRHNESRLQALNGQSFVFDATIEDEFPESAYPADARLTLKVGAQVMFIKNDPSTDHAYYNGKIGRVVGFRDGNVVVHCKDDDRNIEVGMAEWQNTKYEINPDTKEISERVVGTFRQIPLRLAWAITVHKSQGLTFDHAVLDINESFAHGQVYVALSRCRSLEGMVLSRPIEVKSLLTDEDVNNYISKELENTAKAKEQLDSLRFRYFHKLLIDMFNYQRLQSDLHYVVRVCDEHLYRQYPRLTKAWKEASATFDKEVGVVSKKFQQQLTTILAQSSDYQHNAMLQDRVQKASSYFIERLNPLQSLVQQSLPLLGNKTTKSEAEDFAIGNKAVKKQFSNAVEQFNISYRTAVGVLRLTLDHGFSVKTYLKDKANALLAEAETSGGSKKKSPKRPKEPKESTYDTTLRLLREGKTPIQIAEERNLSLTTIYAHLFRFVENGEIDGTPLTTPQRVAEVQQLIERIGWPENAYAFSKMLPGLSFGELNIILHIIRKRENGE